MASVAITKPPVPRHEYLADLRARALEIARTNDLVHAVQIMQRGLDARPDTKVHFTKVTQGTMLVMNDDKPGVIKWIEGFQ
jgi:hypothetical protein